VSLEKSNACDYDKTKKKTHARRRTSLDGAASHVVHPSSVITNNYQLHNSGTVLM